MSISELAKRPDASPYDRLAALGIVLPAAPSPIANFVTHVAEGKLLFLSGQGPTEADGTPAYRQGRRRRFGRSPPMRMRGSPASISSRSCRRLWATSAASAASSSCFGMVNATPDFADHPAVIDGCSDLMRDVFGDHRRACALGRGVRLACPTRSPSRSRPSSPSTRPFANQMDHCCANRDVKQ
jgi:hypothetical protein